MRSQKDVYNSARHNETKARILFLLVKTGRYLTTSQVAERCSLTKNNASRQITKLTGQGYCWRKNINGDYKYWHLKPMGRRVVQELWIRTELRKIDRRISLNLKHKIPLTLKKDARELKRKYYEWLWS